MLDRFHLKDLGHLAWMFRAQAPTITNPSFTKIMPEILSGSEYKDAGDCVLWI